jgi:hypothetical protein
MENLMLIIDEKTKILKFKKLKKDEKLEKQKLEQQKKIEEKEKSKFTLFESFYLSILFVIYFGYTNTLIYDFTIPEIIKNKKYGMNNFLYGIMSSISNISTVFGKIIMVFIFF